MSSADPVIPADPPSPPSSAALAGREIPAYRKLPGRMATLRVGNYGSRKLYLGSDHLLQVENAFGTESYRRFAYADIQALLLRQTSRGLIVSIVLGLLAAGSGLFAWLTSDSPSAAVMFWLCVGGLLVFFLVVNLLRGPTCRCQLQTAIGPQPLLSLSRLRPARRALALLQARIEAAQGTLTPGEAATLLDEHLTRTAVPRTGGPTGSPFRPAPY